MVRVTVSDEYRISTIARLARWYDPLIYIATKALRRSGSQKGNEVMSIWLRLETYSVHRLVHGKLGKQVFVERMNKYVEISTEICSTKGAPK